jgi:hypothetical protein
MTIGIPKPSSLPDMPQEQDVQQEQMDMEQSDAYAVPEEKLITQDDLNLNHEQRIQALEAAFMRVRGAI